MTKTDIVAFNAGEICLSSLSSFSTSFSVELIVRLSNFNDEYRVVGTDNTDILTCVLKADFYVL